MVETREDLVALDGKRNWAASVRLWTTIAGILVTGLVSTIAAVKVAISDSHDKVEAATVHADKRIQETKNEAEAGFQFTKKWADSVEARFAQLEAGRKPQLAAKKGTAHKTPAAPAKAALPGDLAKAEKLVPRAAAPPVSAPAVGDAAAPR